MFEIVYYSDEVMDAICQWPTKVRVSYFRIASLIEERGPNLGLPHTRAMGDGLFEIRAKGMEGIGRALFCTIRDNRIVVLHAFIKKTQKTPAKELEIARKRLAEVKHG